ncbi:hypothetical protein Ddye_019132 [Dipteronia dyeriana]|uniref:Exopolygalacturonase n=1 Tax=Dipteronia dyeriana TaxID=168575 RepID=A0AAD9WVF6_9ROSI|nr:hypothetical protein Ddye_019132 [Dipteronia dyeriana]
MGLMMVFGRVLFVMVMLEMVSNGNADQSKLYKVFDVTKYGAIPNSRPANTRAFSRAWSDACKWNGNSSVLVPAGNFMLGSITFAGPCKNPISFTLKGTLKAPSNLSVINKERWITFQHVTGLVVNGGGTFDGNGVSNWKYITPNSNPLPISVTFQFVKNAKINRITSLNSKNAHISLYGCDNVHFNKVRITAPGDSPNTDGIKMGHSKRIRISKTSIGTGDDCIAILSGSSKIHVSDVFCGPGHGISVGSLGKYKDEKDVVGLNVKNCTLKDTTNGLRIKTMASSTIITASGFNYENIFMNNVQNPIIIDQNYCPHLHCNQQASSHVQIKDITYKNIWGTSSTKLAVGLQCSSRFPCKNIVLNDINLVHNGPEGFASSFCSNVKGASYGRQTPAPCI